jgi:hypothetical protein
MTAEWNSALPFLEKSRHRIESDIGQNNPVVLSVWGNLHLKSGLAAARAGKRDFADAHLGEAKETAKRVGVDRDDYRLCFGPTNVNIWSVGLAVEMLDGTEAVKRSDKFTIRPPLNGSASATTASISRAAASSTVTKRNPSPHSKKPRTWHRCKPATTPWSTKPSAS